jgi:DNA-directed RNA polymerase beta subunit
VADKTVSGLIDKVYVYNDENNMKNCKIRMRKIRTPELGDKCCSKHAQKGVIGMLIPSEDMPFTANGIIPDIIINPHCIPSRMTIAHLLECLLGKFGALQGTTIDGTPFCDSDYSEIFDLLETKFHLNRHGNEIMYNGITGTMMQADIFIGPIFYERLKHMVGDKINYRASGGQISALTRQPNKGRSSGSALRLGEMESNVLAAHGISSFFKESFVERSDNYEFLLDKKTHFISNDYNSLDTIKIKAPFAMKQLLQEITALGIKPELFTEELSDEETYDDNEFVEASSEVVE